MPAHAPVPAGFVVQLRGPTVQPQAHGGAWARLHWLRSLAAAPEAAADGGARWHVFRPTRPLDAAAARELEASLRADPRVLRVVPDVREQRQDAVVPDDARYAEQWWLHGLAADRSGVARFAQAWQTSTGRAGVAPVAVLDSGITSHPETNARVLAGWDFVADSVYAGDGDGRDNDPADPGDAITDAERAAEPAAFGGCPPAPRASWHGTTIAGQLAALSANREGVAAANWQGTVQPVRVAGKCGAAVSDIIDGLRWAAGLAVSGAPVNPTPARVVVLSYGSLSSCDTTAADAAQRDTAQLYVQTLAELRRAGVLVVVAAGNQRMQPGRPADCDGAWAVAAANREGFKASYSNFGAKVALLAPGGDAASGGTCDAELADSGIVSTGNLGGQSPGVAGYVAASGTSFAAPQVAAAAALMLAVNPGLGVAQLEEGLRRSARAHVRAPLLGDCEAGRNAGRCSCTTATCGAGLLDAAEALRYAMDPAVYAGNGCSAAQRVDARHQTCAVLLGRVPAEPLPAADAGSCADALPVASGGGSPGGDGGTGGADGGAGAGGNADSASNGGGERAGGATGAWSAAALLVAIAALRRRRRKR